VHCAPWAKVCPASSPAQHMGWLGLGWQPIAKKQRSLAVDMPWQRSGRLWPAGGDGRWGTMARARGCGEGPIRGGRGGGSTGAHPGQSMVVWLDREKPATGVGIGGHRGCRSGR
jgi:hypothetical protein